MDSPDKMPDCSYIYKWQYVSDNRRIGPETQTVPDMVMSMKEIYERYAVTGDLSALPGAMRPITVDDDDDDYFGESFEEPLDVLQARREFNEYLQDSSLLDVNEDLNDDEHSEEEEKPADEPPAEA